MKNLLNSLVNSLKAVLVQAAFTVFRMPQTGWLNQQRLFIIEGSWKSKISIPAWSGSYQGTFPGLQTTAFLLHPCSVDRECTHTLIPSFPYEDTRPVMGLQSHDLIQMQLPLQILSNWGLGLKNEFQGDPVVP